MMNVTEDDKLMDVEEENLQSKSVDDALSCSSSILDTPRKKGNGENDDASNSDEDDLNVTLLSSPPPVDISATQPREDQQDSELRGEPMIFLSGAGKKRFKRLIASGVEAEEARRLARFPLHTPDSDQSKRSRNSESNSSGENPRPKKQGRPTGSKLPLGVGLAQQRLDMIRSKSSGQSKRTEGRVRPSYKDALTSVKVGILSKDYPNTELTMHQLIATQKAVLNKVVQQRKEKIKPKFGNCLFRPGYLIVICKNQETSDWLKNIITNITPWVGAELIAVDEDQIPQPQTLIGFFPMSADDSDEEILALLEAQNEGLVVDCWKIYLRKIINKRHVELTFSVDGVSMKTLEECGFVLDYKFGNAPIRKKIPKNKESEEMEVDKDLEANNATETCGTGDDTVGGNTTNLNVPGPSGVISTERTPSKPTEANSITTTSDKTGDGKVGVSTTNQNVPGLTDVQNTGRTPSKADYRDINVPAGNDQAKIYCKLSSGERNKVPKEHSHNRNIQ